MNLEEFLSSHRLSDYYPRIAQIVELPSELAGYSGEELKNDFGIDKRAHRNRLLQAIALLPQGGKQGTEAENPVSRSVLLRLDALPAVIALPLKEYCEESHPTMQLWAACDTVEMLLRFLVISAIAEQRQGGKLDSKLVRELSGQIESPTLGAWYSMAVKLANTTPEQSFMPEYAESVNGVLRELLYGPDNPGNPETSFLRLRNRLAHGGGMPLKEGARLLGLWQERFESALGACAWLEELNLIGRRDDGAIVCLDGLAGPQPFELPEALKLEESGSLWLVRGSSHCLLWPLAVFGRAMTETLGDSRQSDTVHAQIYSRKEAVRLTYTPLGAAGFNYSESGPGEMEAFERLFSVDIGDRKGGFAIQDFDHELLRDAGQMVGRRKELVAMQEALTCKREGVWWLTGTAGMGKSFLVAKLFEELNDASADEDGTHVLAYRFRAGDEGRCNRDAFTTFVIERLQAKGILHERFKPKKDGKTAERLEHCLNEMKQGQQVTFLLDGLDEITRSDPDFAAEIPLALRLPRIRWFLAGRPEAGLVRAMRENAAIPIFPDGLPLMGDDDIRGMILDKIGPLRKKLLVNDHEQEDKVENPFISLVTRRAEGLPLYVKYVIGDVLGNKYRVLDGEEQLPPNLQAYHEKLIERLGIGSLQAILTPLACLLALSKEPLSRDQLRALLTIWKLLPDEASSTALLEQGLAALVSMLKAAPTADGENGYTLYHASLRDHFLGAPKVAETIAAARGILADCAEIETPRDCLQNYLLRFGIDHLLEAGREEAAEKKLLNLLHIYAMAVKGVTPLKVYRWWVVLGGEERAMQYSDWPAFRIRDNFTPSGRVRIGKIYAAYSFVLSVCREGEWGQLGIELGRGLSLGARLLPGRKNVFALKSLVEHGHFLADNGEYQKAETMLRRALDIAKRQNGKESREVFAIMDQLAGATKSGGNYTDAEILYREALEGKERRLGKEHESTLYSVHNLGILLQEKVGSDDEAEALLRRSVEDSKRILGERHTLSIQSLCSLGAFLTSKGAYEEAEVLLNQSLTLSQDELGEEHPAAQAALKSLADLHDKQGNYDAAEDHLQRLLDVTVKAKGAVHEDTLKVVDRLSLVLLEKQSYSEAAVGNRHCFETRKRTLGEEDPLTLESLSNLAIALELDEKLDEAEPLHRKIVEIRERTLGEEDSLTLDSLEDLAWLEQSKENYEGAKSLMSRILEIRKRTLGEEDPLTLRALEDLAHALVMKDEYDEAEPLRRKIVEIRERTLGEEDPLTLASLEDLALLLKSKENYDEAEPLMRRCLEIRKVTLGEEDPLTLEALEDLAHVHQMKHEYDEAEPLRRQCLEIRERTLGEEDPLTLKSLASLARLLEWKESYDEAEPLTRRCLGIRKRTLGEEDPLTLESLGALARLNRSIENYDEAESLICRILEIRKRTLGEEDPLTLEALEDLSYVLELKHEYDKAETLSRQCLEIYERTLGNDDRHTEKALENLARLMRFKKDDQKLELLHRRVLERELAGGPENSDFRQVFQDIIVLQLKRDMIGAERLLRETLGKMEKVLGSESSDTKLFSERLASHLEWKGDYDGAEQLYRRGLEINEKTEGRESGLTIKSVHHLARILKIKKCYEEAENLYRRGYDAVMDAMGPKALDSIMCCNQLGCLLELRGKYEEAEVLVRKGLEVSEETHGAVHKATISLRNLLGKVLTKIGYYDEAEHHLVEAYERSLECWGPQDPNTIRVMINLLDCRFLAGAKNLPVEELEEGCCLLELEGGFHEWVEECRDLIAKIKKRAEGESQG